MQPNSTESEKADMKPNLAGFALGIVSVVVAVFGFIALKAYGTLHWKIIGDHYSELAPSLRADLFSLLTSLEIINRGLGITALVFAISCFVRKEAVWARVLAIIAALISMLLIFGVM
jgi:hypothetical protein